MAQSTTQNAAARYHLNEWKRLDGVEPCLIGDEIYRWDDQVWRIQPERVLYQHLTEPQSPAQLKTAAAVAGAIKIMRMIAPEGPVPQSGVACRNGFVTIDEATGQVQLHPHHPDQGQTWLLDVDYDPTALATLWEQTLADILDPSCVPVLRMSVGAALMGLATRYEHAFALPGRGNNGRSTVLAVLRALFDPSVVVAIPPQAWASNFQLAELCGARLNSVAEMPSKQLMDSERFKAVITGRDLITAEKKYRDPFRFIPTAAHFFAPNELPAVADQTDGFWRRWIVIPFERQITKPDLYRAERVIHNELPGVLAFAVDGARRLIRNGRYLTGRMVEARKEEWRMQTDHVLRFVREACELVADPKDGDTAAEVIQALHVYLQDQHVRTISAPRAGERLKQLLGPKGKGWDKFSDANRYAIKVKPELAMLAQLMREGRLPRA